MNIQTIGSSLGPLVIIFGVGGYLLSGRTVNWMVERGIANAPMVYPSRTIAAMGVVGALAPQVPSAPLALVMFSMVSLFSTVGAMAAIALYVTTPNHLRGSVAALFIICSTMMGSGSGPMATGALTTYFFHDRARVGDSITLMFVACCSVSVLLLALGSKMMAAILGSRTPPSAR